MDNMISIIGSQSFHTGLNNAELISARNSLERGKVTGLEQVARSGSFEQALLQTLDKVSERHVNASALVQEAIVNPDAVDAHDITIAQGMANMSLDITRNVLNRLVQGWRDLINTR